MLNSYLNNHCFDPCYNNKTLQVLWSSFVSDYIMIGKDDSYENSNTKHIGDNLSFGENYNNSVPGTNFVYLFLDNLKLKSVRRNNVRMYNYFTSTKEYFQLKYTSIKNLYLKSIKTML